VALYKGGPSQWKSIIFADPNDSPTGSDDEVEMNWRLKYSLCDVLAAFYEVILDVHLSSNILSLFLRQN